MSNLRQVLPDARLLVCEPYVTALPTALADLGGIELVGLAEALTSANVVVLLVDHDAFRAVTPEQLAGRVVHDTRGLWHA